MLLLIVHMYTMILIISIMADVVINISYIYNDYNSDVAINSSYAYNDTNNKHNG